MSLDRRLRDELRRDADRIVTDIDRNLGAVEASARRRSSVGPATLIAVTAVLAVAVGIRLGSTPPQTGTTPAPANSPQATSAAPSSSPLPSFGAIAGTYTVLLDSSDAAVAQNHLTGTWTMRLLGDGELFLSPPAGFGSGTSSLSGLAFTLAADRFRSNIFYNDFCNSIGTYTWALTAGQLSFAPVDDTCAIRRALLSTTPWRVGQ